MLKTHEQILHEAIQRSEQMMNEIIADNCRKAAVQLDAAYKKIKKYDPDNRENAVAVLWLAAQAHEMANEYQNKAEAQ
jgi:hypothetical protein